MRSLDDMLDELRIASWDVTTDKLREKLEHQYGRLQLLETARKASICLAQYCSLCKSGRVPNKPPGDVLTLLVCRCGARPSWVIPPTPEVSLVPAACPSTTKSSNEHMCLLC
jgi:hypothetical protein